MELRHIFLITAILATAVFVVPTIYPLFAGQHWLYDTKTSANDVPCQKCHSDIGQELDSSTHHSSFTCEDCHVSEITSNLTHGNVVAPRCLECHGTPPRTGAPTAKIFGENNITNKESHNPFIAGANTTLLLKGENEACVACHTRKALRIEMLYADTYKFNSKRIVDSTWELSNYSKNVVFASPLLIQSNESHGQHTFPTNQQIKCEKCHPNTRNELNSSIHHTYFSCASCHRLYSTYHASSTPPCLDCHGSTPRIVTDLKNRTFVAPVAPVYAANEGGADAHIPFVLSANISKISTESDAACSSCHSSFNNNINFIRPSFIEWDVVASGGMGGSNWMIQNLTFGPLKEVKVTKYLDGKIHNTSVVSNISCVSCHEDIRQAVYAGGHSNEQWKQKHNYTSYIDMNSYCKSCHKPVTQRSDGASPYPEYPFTSPNHGSIKISCVDCHCKPDLDANISAGWETPLPMGSHKGSIEISMREQPLFTQSYICLACKNAGSPKPDCNQPLHFKIYTEPEVTIYVNGVQKYPK